MGLDMTLTAERYVSTFDSTDQKISREIAQLFPELADSETVCSVEVRAGYWRKANAIHRWFVENVQEGVDDCGEYVVSGSQMARLKELCERVLKFRHLAVEQLPTTDGFFFGSTAYDEGYFQDLEKTVEILDRAIQLDSTGDWDIKYQSSW